MPYLNHLKHEATTTPSRRETPKLGGHIKPQTQKIPTKTNLEKEITIEVNSPQASHRTLISPKSNNSETILIDEKGTLQNLSKIRLPFEL